jgi:Restriction endonuclease
LIRRIYELLEHSGAQVTWNDHVADPDNPSQMRQIDITIKRGEQTTLVECRRHRRPQGVKWVEELIGRRQSLAADGVIAVSSSGFTKGALLKAQRYSVILRDLHRLTDADVQSWGKQIGLTLFFYQYSDLDLSLYFKDESLLKLDRDKLKEELRSHQFDFLYEAAAEQIDSLNLVGGEHEGRTVNFAVRAGLQEVILCGESVTLADFRGKARLVSRDVISPEILSFGAPPSFSESRRAVAVVEKFPLGETSIIHDERRISLLLDLSQVAMPPFCQFRFFRTSDKVREKTDFEQVELAGLHKLRVPGGRVRVNIASMSYARNNPLQLVGSGVGPASV